MFVLHILTHFLLFRWKLYKKNTEEKDNDAKDDIEKYIYDEEEYVDVSDFVCINDESELSFIKRNETTDDNIDIETDTILYDEQRCGVYNENENVLVNETELIELFGQLKKIKSLNAEKYYRTIDIFNQILLN